MARYEVKDESTSGHCCFECTVVDTQHVDSVTGEVSVASLCETFDPESARRICDALNAAV